LNFKKKERGSSVVPLGMTPKNSIQQISEKQTSGHES